MNSRLKIFSGSASLYLAKNIVKSCGIKLGLSDIQRFSDGEYQPSYNETVRGDFVFIIQSTFQPSDNLFELLMMIDAAKRASAYKIVAVIPYMGFARQDRKDKPRVAIGAKLVADLLTVAGVSRIITMDLHADQIQGFFNVPVDHLFASTIFVPYLLKNVNLDNLLIASPDTGGTKRANAYAKFLKVGMVICYKVRAAANVISKIKVIGKVKDKDIILIDDIVDTAGTITIAANMLIKKGAKSVKVIATHGVLSGPAYERIENSKISELIITDTIPLKRKSKKIKVISIAELFGDIIQKVCNYKSISSSFIDYD